MKNLSEQNLPVTIIGAGPAGLSAAIQLAEFGVRSVVIDENPKVGGVVFRHSERRLKMESGAEDDTKKRAELLFKELEKNREYITLLLKTQVLGTIDDQGALALLDDEQKLKRVKPSRLILSMGCHEKAQPFPGWTLPGVMTVGGAQIQVKNGLVKPGKKIVLAGTGPLLLVAAKQLHQAGVEVLGVYEAGRRFDLLRKFPSLLSDLSSIKEGLSYINYLRRSRIPLRYGWGIVEARGEEELEEAVLAPYDPDWRPIQKEAIAIETDCLGVGYGFVSRTQLTQLLGCRHEYVRETGGLRPITNEWQETSRERVYVAGDCAGVFGSEAASEEGKLAAIGCLFHEGIIGEEEAHKLASPIRKKLAKLIQFRRAFDHFSSPRPGLLELPRDDTVICRCENVTLGEIKDAVSRGISDITSLKMATRIGMGDCQGKLCGSFCTELLMNREQKSAMEVGELRPRFPLAPLSFSSLRPEGGETR